MYIKPVSIFALSALVITLSACGGGGGSADDDAGGGSGTGGGGGGSGTGGGGGGGPVDPPPPVSALFIASDAERSYYENTLRPDATAAGPASVAGGTTPFGTLPATGSISYAGYMDISVGDATASANVTAPTNLTLQLGSGLFDGSATGFMGVAMDETLVQRVVNYAGTIAISGGGISRGVYGNTAVTFNIDGTLDSGLNVFGIDGTLVGSLYDTGGAGLRVRGTNTGLDGSMMTTVDGNPGVVGVATVSARSVPQN